MKTSSIGSLLVGVIAGCKNDKEIFKEGRASIKAQLNDKSGRPDRP